MRSFLAAGLMFVCVFAVAATRCVIAAVVFGLMTTMFIGLRPIASSARYGQG